MPPSRRPQRLMRQPKLRPKVRPRQSLKSPSPRVAVRAAGSHGIGFLSDVRRMNVALTRARRKLIVIGDSATIASHQFYSELLSYFEEQGAYHSVWEEQD